MNDKTLTVQELINKLQKIENKDTLVEVSTGHFEKGGRFVGELHRVSTIEDYRGKRIRLTGFLEG